jgi:hypothetical protein
MKTTIHTKPAQLFLCAFAFALSLGVVAQSALTARKRKR